MTEDKKEDGVGTLKKDRTLLLRDERKMEKLKAKLHTDDDCECWLAKGTKGFAAIFFCLFLAFSVNKCDSTVTSDCAVSLSFNSLHGHDCVPSRLSPSTIRYSQSSSVCCVWCVRTSHQISLPLSSTGVIFIK